MGVHSSSGAVLHSVIAIFGSNRMLEPIWKVVDTVKAMTAVFSGAKLSKKELRGFNYLKKRSEELDSSDNEEEVRYPAEEFIDIPKYLESLKEISNLDAFFQKNASCRCGPFVDKPLAMSTKEKEVFDAWKKHYQKQIDFLMEKANSMTSENKMSSISQLKNIARKNR